MATVNWLINNILKIASFVFNRGQTHSGLEELEGKWWQIVHFWVAYPFKSNITKYIYTVYIYVYIYIYMYHDVGRTVCPGGFVSCLGLISVVCSCGFFKSCSSKSPFATWYNTLKKKKNFYMQFSMQQNNFFYFGGILKKGSNSHQLSVCGSADGDFWIWACRPAWHFPTIHLWFLHGAGVHGMTWGWTTTNMNNWRRMLCFFCLFFLFL